MDPLCNQTRTDLRNALEMHAACLQQQHIKDAPLPGDENGGMGMFFTHEDTTVFLEFAYGHIRVRFGPVYVNNERPLDAPPFVAYGKTYDEPLRPIWSEDGVEVPSYYDLTPAARKRLTALTGEIMAAFGRKHHDRLDDWRDMTLAQEHNSALDHEYANVQNLLTYLRGIR